MRVPCRSRSIVNKAFIVLNRRNPAHAGRVFLDHPLWLPVLTKILQITKTTVILRGPAELSRAGVSQEVSDFGKLPRPGPSVKILATRDYIGTNIAGFVLTGARFQERLVIRLISSLR